MKTTLGERLKDFINYKEIKNIEFAAAVSATQQEVTNWSNGRGLALNRLVGIINAYPKLNARWLLTGEGEMLNSYEPGNEVSEPGHDYNNYCKLCDEKDHRIEELKENIEDLRSVLNLSKKETGFADSAQQRQFTKIPKKQ